jgi:hypothetical protein
MQLEQFHQHHLHTLVMSDNRCSQQPAGQWSAPPSAQRGLWDETSAAVAEHTLHYPTSRFVGLQALTEECQACLAAARVSDAGAGADDPAAGQ